MTKVPTIKLAGKNYAQVKDRIKAFLEAHTNGAIQTSPNISGESCFIQAKVIPDTSNATRFFTASSYGPIKGLKAFEELETIAVGRALAYLGYGIDGSITSKEEIEDYAESQSQNRGVIRLSESQFRELIDSKSKEKIEKALATTEIEGYKFVIPDEMAAALELALMALE